MMDRTKRPLVIVGAFTGSLVVGLLVMLWALGGLRNVAAPAAIGGPFQLTDQSGQTVTEKNLLGRPTLIMFGFTHRSEGTRLNSSHGIGSRMPSSA